MRPSFLRTSFPTTLGSNSSIQSSTRVIMSRLVSDIKLVNPKVEGHPVIETRACPSNPFDSHSDHPQPRPSSSSSSRLMPETQPHNITRAPATLAPLRSFYQRQLPQSCLSFTSNEGKSLFRSALAAGHLESFFPLASQLVTQHDPSFCGLATLCTVLNALGVDPKRVWKHPWRWYEQDMLDCCRPLESIRQSGITLAEFNCLARCNGLALVSRSPPSESRETDSTVHQEAIQEFRSAVLSTTASSSALMVVSFCRATLGQTGTGHFSPVAGYSPEHDRVLILDVARFKYPSYWVRLEELYDSMIPIDPASGRSRGYTILSYSPFLEKTNCLTCNPNPPSLTRITLNKSSWAILSRDLLPILESIKSESVPVSIQKIMDHISVVLRIPSPIEIRPGLESEAQEMLSRIYSSNDLSINQGGDDPNQPDPLLTLFALAVLPTPGHHSHQLDLQFLELELNYLRCQLSALGECCSLEGDESNSINHRCGCQRA